MSIIVVEPTSSGVALVEAAHQLGESVVVFTQNLRDLPSSCKALTAGIVELDTNDVRAVVLAADAATRTRSFASDRPWIMLPGFEYVVDVVAEASERLAWPHLSVQAAALARDKFLCREHLRRHGLDVPRYALVSGQAEARRAADDIGFPAVIKPVDGCGSLLVRRVDSMQELIDYFRHATKAGVVDMGKRIGSRFLLEEFVDGREFSIEGYIDRGTPHVAAITEKRLGPEPFFVEMGHIVPAAIDLHERQALVTYIEAVVRAVGLDLGVFHAEARLSDQGPRLIEIAARLGGDRIYRLVELATGLSLPKTMIRSYRQIPEPAAFHPLSRPGVVAGIRFLSNNDGQALALASAGMNRVRNLKGFKEADFYFKTGEAVPELTDFRGRVGHVLFEAEDRAALDALLNRAESSFESTPSRTLEPSH